MRISHFSWLVLASLVTCSTIMAADLYVSPTGRDTNPGSQTQPVASLARARDLVQPLAGKQAVTVHVADGIYYLPETLVFTPQDSGTAGKLVIYRAENEGGAVLSGGVKLNLAWKAYRDGIYQAKTPAGLVIDQLFINGKNQRMARYPNYDPERPTAAYQGYAADAFAKERAAGWADPTGGYIHAMHSKRWGGYHYRITGKDADGNVTYEGGWQNNRQMGMHKEFRMVENIFEELDAAGEWYHNAKTNILYYKPTPETDLSKALVEVVRLRHLVEFQGTETSPVKFITLQGFVVRHAARTFMDCKEPLLRSDWTIYRGGAFFLTGTEDIQILDSEFDQVGGNAIFVSNYNRRTLVKGCHIHDTGASGVCFVGDPGAVRNPCFEYGERNELSEISREVGPKTHNYPSYGVVEDCLIHGIGRVERQPAGVQISMSQDITVRDCSVYDCARAGINISEGTWGGHLIEGCDVFDTVMETHDHGSFNSWGRDRYWKAASNDDLAADPNLPFLDAMKTTIIRNSRWRCDHGWDIDLDDGSSNYDIYNNLMLRGGLKFREGFRRRAWNNIMVNNSFHPHVWYPNSEDEFYQNIVMTDIKGIRAPTNQAKGKYIGKNLFFVSNPKYMDKYAKQGWDRDSVVGDALFVDPAKGDFRVKDGSPALKLGFKNFPMDQFGVKKPSLKAIAKTPVIPELNNTVQAKSTPASLPEPTSYWLGAKLYSIQGEAFSAFGTRKEDGGVALVQIAEGSPLAAAGFLANDLIQGLNGMQVKNVSDLLTAYAKAGDADLKVKVVRFQQTMIKTIKGAPSVRVQGRATAGALATSTSGSVTSNPATSNDPIRSLSAADDTKSLDPYANETQAQRDARMAWFREAKFGMFIHWGVYAVPAGTYKGKQIPGLGEWIMARGKIPMAEYQQYAKKFNPVKYDPDAWVRLAKEAGMKYIVITSKHHDGFALYDSKVSEWDVVDATPYGKDLIAPLAAACRKHGLKLGLYYSQAQDWNQGGASGNWDPEQQHDMDDYIRDIAVPQVREILTQYSPDILWWDTPHQMTNERAEKFLPLLKLRPGIIHNNRLGGDYKGDISTPEQHIPGTGLAGDWESCMTMNRTWGFKSYDHDWKSTETLIQNLIDIASKGGNYLLNVGPTAEGLIPEPSIERLKAIGHWMKANSESIYGTTASPCRTPAWGRITKKVRGKNTRLYLHVFDWPSNGELFLPLVNKVQSCQLLVDRSRQFKTQMDERGTTVMLTGEAPDPMSSVVVMNIAGEPKVSDADKIFQQADGEIVLPAQKAILNNVRDSHLLYNKKRDCLEGWTEGRGHLASIDWEFVVKSPGRFRVSVLASSPAGSALKLTVHGQSLKVKIPATDNFATVNRVNAGTVKIDEPGDMTIHVERTRQGWTPTKLHSVTLTPEQ